MSLPSSPWSFWHLACASRAPFFPTSSAAAVRSPRSGSDSRPPADRALNARSFRWDRRQPAESYFDPEPPLAKLLMAPPIAVFGFNSWTWRLGTTLFGSLLVGLMYLVALRLRRDRFFAT